MGRIRTSMDTAMLPPRVGLHLDGRTFPAIPVHLQGHEASLLFLFAPPAGRDVLLVLDWGKGVTTELRARVRAVVTDDRAKFLRQERGAGARHAVDEEGGLERDALGCGSVDHARVRGCVWVFVCGSGCWYPVCLMIALADHRGRVC